MTEINKTNQINLKLGGSMLEDARKYANKFGYTNIQELIRESLRDKIYEDLKVKNEYIKELLKLKENDFLSVDDSKKALNILKKQVDE